MLRDLDIKDMLIIDHLSLEFQPGLNVLTGETGAGKSILLDSLGFVLGWRGRAELVRAGAEQGEVTASFDIAADHPAMAIMAEAGLPIEDGELILRRINRADGRKTAWVNGQRCSGDTLRQLSETLIELHGQHDDRGLLNPRGHRQLLDAYGGLGPKLEKTRKSWRKLAEATRELAQAQEKIQALREEEDFLRAAVAELDDLAPQPGEEAALDTHRRLLQASERVREDILKAHTAIGGQGAEDQMVNAQRWLEGANALIDSQLDTGIGAMGRALDALAEAQQEIERTLDALDFDPTELENTEERLFAIRGLARKHNVLPDELATFADDLRRRLTTLDAGADDLIVLEDAKKAAQAGYDEMAQNLSEARLKSARKLDRAMHAELAPLKMERAVFTTQFTPLEPGPEGQDEVTFTVATNPGAPAGALNKIASGGELSRFLLALKVCLTAQTTGLTMIFDEIDRGVGGATADAVGKRLADLAQSGQILTVTHSPQVAALGAHHWRVEKQVNNGMTTSTVVPLDAGQRVDEIARMLAGDTITEPARAAAKSLLVPVAQ